jgi:cytochrome c-type biogenesis protein CcmH
MRRLPSFVCAILLLTVPVAAQDIEPEARAIEAMLVAPCCWMQQVSLHQSEAATKIKEEIRVSLREGRTRQQILDGYVATYGPRILIEPPARGFGVSLYVLPAIPLLATALLDGMVVRRFTARGTRSPRPPEQAGGAAAEDAALSDKLDDELRELD